MRRTRVGATIAAGLFSAAAVVGLGFGTAQADPVSWTADAETTATLDMGDGPATRELPTGTFDGEVDEDQGTITGSVDHPDFAIEIDNPLDPTGDPVELGVHLAIEDIDLDWDQDGGNVDGTSTLLLSLLDVALGDGIDLGECTVRAPIDAIGTFVDGQLEFGGDLGEIELIGDCNGLAGLIQDLLGGITGDVVTTVGGADEPDPEETTTTTEAEETTTTTVAPTPGPGATPIPGAPNYTG